MGKPVRDAARRSSVKRCREIGLYPSSDRSSVAVCHGQPAAPFPPRVPLGSRGEHGRPGREAEQSAHLVGGNLMRPHRAPTPTAVQGDGVRGTRSERESVRRGTVGDGLTAPGEAVADVPAPVGQFDRVGYQLLDGLIQLPDDSLGPRARAGRREGVRQFRRGPTGPTLRAEGARHGRPGAAPAARCTGRLPRRR